MNFVSFFAGFVVRVYDIFEKSFEFSRISDSIINDILLDTSQNFPTMIQCGSLRAFSLNFLPKLPAIKTGFCF